VPGLENDPNFLSRVITGDESWCYGYDPESKQASSQWETPRSPRPKKNQTGVIECQNNVDLFLRHSRSCAQGTRSQGSDGQTGTRPGGFETTEGEGAEDKAGIVAFGRMAHYHDNAPAHTALRIRQFLTCQGMTLVPHPPYSSDLAPADFFCFPE